MVAIASGTKSRLKSGMDKTIEMTITEVTESFIPYVLLCPDKCLVASILYVDYSRLTAILFSNLQKISEFFDNEVSPDDVIDVDKVVGEILSHPHRKHFGTLDLPNDKSMLSPTPAHCLQPAPSHQ